MSYTYTHLEDFIRRTYHDLRIRNPDQLNLYSIADTLDIGVYPISTSTQAIRFEGRQYIFMNSRLTAPERFERFGHELGHILLHTGNQQHMEESFRSYQEWKANLFALHFCIPTFMLQKLPGYNLNPHRISEIFGVTPSFAHDRLVLHKQRLLHFQSLKILQRRI